MSALVNIVKRDGNLAVVHLRLAADQFRAWLAVAAPGEPGALLLLISLPVHFCIRYT
jgi:hypothetical protein